MNFSTPPPSILQSTKISSGNDMTVRTTRKRQRADGINTEENYSTPTKRLVRSTSFTSSPVVHVSSDAMNDLCFSRFNFGWSTFSLASNGSAKKSTKTNFFRQAFRNNSPAACKTHQCDIPIKEDGMFMSFRNTMFKKSKKDSRVERNLKRHCSFNDGTVMAKKNTAERRKSFGDIGKRVGNVWLNVTLTDVLTSKELVEAFRAFLKSEFSEENLDFWLECEELKNIKPSKMLKSTSKIYERYIAVGSPREINLDSNTRKLTKERILSGQIGPLDPPQKHIYDLMYRDSFPRFTLTKEFQSIAENLERENMKIKCAKEAKKSFRIKKPLSQFTSSIQIRKRKIYASL